MLEHRDAPDLATFKGGCMAIWKLSLPLFSAKPPDLGSLPKLHFIAAARPRTHQYAVVCESQPLMTF